jgi:hypothetical protein
MLNTGIRHSEPPLADHPPHVNDARDSNGLIGARRRLSNDMFASKPVNRRRYCMARFIPSFEWAIFLPSMAAQSSRIRFAQWPAPNAFMMWLASHGP